MNRPRQLKDIQADILTLSVRMASNSARDALAVVDQVGSFEVHPYTHAALSRAIAALEEAAAEAVHTVAAVTADDDEGGPE